MSAEERLTTCSQVLEIMEKTGFPCYVRALEQVRAAGEADSAVFYEKSNS